MQVGHPGLCFLHPVQGGGWLVIQGWTGSILGSLLALGASICPHFGEFGWVWIKFVSVQYLCVCMASLGLELFTPRPMWDIVLN